MSIYIQCNNKMETGVAKYEPRTAVSVRREMAMQTEVMEALNPMERSVFLAATAKNFDEFDEKELASEIAKALKFIMKDVGYRETNDNDKMYLAVRLTEVMKRHYADLSMRDFRIAFEMAITGALDEFLPRNSNGQADRGHYQNFSAEYVCKILNAYKQKRLAVLDKAYKVNPTKDDSEQQRNYKQTIAQEILDAFGYYKAKKQLPELSPIRKMLFYNELVEAGLAREIELTDEDCESMIQRTMDYYKGKGQYGEAVRIYKQGKDAPEVKSRAEDFAKLKAITDCFDEMIAKGKVMSEYIRV